MATLSKSSTVPEVVREEQAILDRVQTHITRTGSRRALGMNYDEELIALRDALAEAKPEDIPPLVEQMTRLQLLDSRK